jgi:hypothetical protein
LISVGAEAAEPATLGTMTARSTTISDPGPAAPNVVPILVTPLLSAPLKYAAVGYGDAVPNGFTSANARLLRVPVGPSSRNRRCGRGQGISRASARTAGWHWVPNRRTLGLVLADTTPKQDQPGRQDPGHPFVLPEEAAGRLNLRHRSRELRLIQPRIGPAGGQQ